MTRQLRKFLFNSAGGRQAAVDGSRRRARPAERAIGMILTAIVVAVGSQRQMGRGGKPHYGPRGHRITTALPDSGTASVSGTSTLHDWTVTWHGSRGGMRFRGRGHRPRRRFNPFG